MAGEGLRPGHGPDRPAGPAPLRWAHDRGCPHCHPRERRISARIGAIAESATLKVDAKAKALKAEGRPVIGFGAGEPDFPTPAYVVDAAVDGLPRPEEPPLHARRRPARAQAGDRGEDPARQRPRDRGQPGRGHQRRQAGHLRGVRDHARPGRRGDRARAVLDDVPRGDPARRRCRRTRPRGRDAGVQGHRRAARGGPHRAHQGAAVRLAVQPDRGRVHLRRDPGDRAVGRGPRALGADRRDLRAPRVRRRRAPAPSRSCVPSSPTTPSSSTVSPRPMR